MEKEYIVVLKKGVDYDAFWVEMETQSDAIPEIPDREVEIVFEKPGSLRSCHYRLTDEEAEILRTDQRVLDVHVPVRDMENVQLRVNAFQTANFNKPAPGTSTGDNTNWGLIRTLSGADVFAAGTIDEQYPYTLDGSGVDVVIIDSGIQVDHPEFHDGSGVSRVQQIDWYDAAGVPGTMPANFYRDYDGHGTHVAGIAAGKTYGWAKNANIYSMKLAGLEGSGDSGTGIDISEAFDLIKLWHSNKPVEPSTGAKRPTVVNMSFGSEISYFDLDEVVYRGDSKTGADIDTTSERWNLGLVPVNDGVVFYAPYRISSVDTDLEELIDEGVIVTIAAGNSYYKIDIQGGLDYDNYFSAGGTTVYYHRGGSPYSEDAIIVGSLSSVYEGLTQEIKSDFSNSGPGVDIYAPGEDIMSCTSTVNLSANEAVYHLDNNYRQENMSGTSMAAPQVCGMLATWAQLYPTLSPLTALNAIGANATTGLLSDSGLTNDYTNLRGLYGGENRILKTRYTSGYKLEIKGS